MALDHIHNSGKHVNKRQQTILKPKPEAVGKFEIWKSFSYTAENTSLENKRTPNNC